MNAAKERDKSTMIILVVDDTDSTRYIITRYLQQAGYRVWEAITGLAGLERARQKPDLIVLDEQLPDIQGYEVCRRLKSAADTASIPVLQVSSVFTRSTDRVRGLEQGADGYIAAPISPDELMAKVRALLRVRQAELEMRHAKERLEFVLSHIVEAFFVLDEQGRVVEINAAAERLFFKKPAEELLGQSFFTSPPCTPELQPKLRQARESGLPVHFESEWAHAGWFEVHLYPQAGRLYVYMRDISGRKSMEQAIRQAEGALLEQNALLEQKVKDRTATLEGSNRALESFCYGIAHDLRAPARAMQGLGSLLLEDYKGILDSTGLDYARRITRAAGKMDTLIQDLLAYGRLSHIPLPMAWIDLQPLLQSISEHFREELAARQAILELGSPLHSTWANATALEQILVNLIANALKFSRSQVPPRIRVHSVQEATGITLNVTDNGIGIAPEHFERIFGVFEQLQTTARYPGTGIGLALVKRGVERMGGRVGVESSVGEGSRFWFNLPMPEA